MKFPKHFVGGVALSGPQTESAENRAPQVMDRFYEIARSRFHDELDVKNAIEKSYPEYVKLARELNVNAYLTSIQGARLMPDGKKVNSEAVKFYRDYFESLKAQGIEPCVVLSQSDLPLFEQLHDGWENKTTISNFVYYAEKAFENFGDLVTKWFTFNEPSTVVEGGYLYDFQFPNKFDMRSAMQVQFNLVIAHLRTVAMFKARQFAGEIGIILNISPAIPRSNHPADIKATQGAEIFQTKVYMEPIFKHFYPQEVIDEARRRDYLGKITSEEKELIVNAPTTDMLGINYYTPLRVKALDFEPNGNGAITPRFYYDLYTMPGRKSTSTRGGEVFAPGLYLALKNVQLNYDNVKTFITENGLGVVEEHEVRRDNHLQDHYRIEFITEHLASLKQAITEGVNCHGYFYGTLVDNWAGISAYRNRYGLVELDLVTGALRKKQSYEWGADFLARQRG